MEMTVLAINLGSASKKYAFYSGDTHIFTAHFEKTEDGFAVSYDADAPEEITEASYEQALAHVVTYAKKRHNADIGAVGLRIVALGKQFADNAFIDARYLELLEHETNRDPDHIPLVIAELAELSRILPGVPLIAASDSAFHKTIPEVAKRYAVPQDTHATGFHGLSVASVASQLGKSVGAMPEKVIVCHLGSGASVTALRNGISVATSMGYSPLGGVPMSTRVGDIDPEVVLQLAEEYGVAETRNILYTKSGLLALSHKSGDMRVLLEAEKQGDTQAKFAIESFVYHLRFYIGAYAALLGGVDMLVFSGTIGIRSEPIRNRVMRGLSYKTIAIKTDEESEIAKAVREMLS